LSPLSFQLYSGSFSSACNIFYDRGGYNAITSLARSLITTAFTAAEQLLAGNFAWFREEDVVTHLLLTLEHKPADEEIDQVTSDFKLYVPSKEDLLLFLRMTVEQYQPRGYQMSIVQSIVDRMSGPETTYMFYYFNMKHLLEHNEHVCRPWIDDVVSLELDGPIPANIQPKDVFKLDEEARSLAMLLANERLRGTKLSKLVAKEPETARWLCALTQQIEQKLKLWQPVVDTFTLRGVGMPGLLDKKNALRKAVIISDTDSVIFTLAPWTRWYTGGSKVTHESYAMSAFMIYWLSKVVAHELRKFSVVHGFDEADLDIMAMKNEFLYPTLLLFDRKKTYAGIQAVREGLVFETPEPDIKGALLRGSTMAKESVMFAADLLVTDILVPAISGRISGARLIQKTLAFEEFIRDATLAGQHTFLKVGSIQPEANYAKPLSSEQLNYSQVPPCSLPPWWL